jgi:hypothetical protein
MVAANVETDPGASSSGGSGDEGDQLAALDPDRIGDISDAAQPVRPAKLASDPPPVPAESPLEATCRQATKAQTWGNDMTIGGMFVVALGTVLGGLTGGPVGASLVFLGTMAIFTGGAAYTSGRVSQEVNQCPGS